MAGFGINTGTATGVSASLSGTTYTPYLKLDIGAGSAFSDFGGTITSIGNVQAGTITRLNGGTITNVSTGTINALAAGTITAGTILPFGIQHPSEIATCVNLTGTATGTLRGAVAGSQLFVTHIVISVSGASNVTIASGTPTVPILGTLFFNANGGIANTPINPPIRTVSGSALVFNQSGTGAMSVTCTGYIK